MTSCATAPYTIKATHDLRVAKVNDGQMAEPQTVKADEELAVEPGLWLLSNSGYNSTFLYIPSSEAKNTVVRLEKSDANNPSPLVHEIFEIQALMRHKSNTEALERIKKLRATYPDVRDLALLQSSIMVLLGDTQGAIDLLKGMLKVNPEDKEVTGLLEKISGGKDKP